MLIRFHSRLGLLAAGVLIVGSTSAYAAGSHHFDIINKSSKPIQIIHTITRCVTSWNMPGVVEPGQTYTVNWEDTNNVFYNCTDRDKFVAFTFSMPNVANLYQGYLGITHRNLSGTKWYNGQFYAQDLKLGNENNIMESDGPAPPNYIKALCSHDNNCFGPASEMEMDNKNSYNWPRSYQTEEGWAFQISDP